MFQLGCDLTVFVLFCFVQSTISKVVRVAWTPGKEEEAKMASEKLCQFSLILLQNIFLFVV